MDASIFGGFLYSLSLRLPKPPSASLSVCAKQPARERPLLSKTYKHSPFWSFEPPGSLFSGSSRLALKELFLLFLCALSPSGFVQHAARSTTAPPPSIPSRQPDSPQFSLRAFDKLLRMRAESLTYFLMSECCKRAQWLWILSPPHTNTHPVLTVLHFLTHWKK